ncbi:MAG: RpiB/LacA/LacB family sugar-phosphate isomerase, partial [Deltaproteobacteria bacterium]|nr:RpiB/LacA/LacB family sugar-phosphate isomerase [Deltaproteobacteria bacterium]
MIAVASDHAGVELKATVINHLEQRGRTVRDFGTGNTASCDYPDYALPAARAVSSGQCELAILICGSGAGMAIAANKVP